MSTAEAVSQQLDQFRSDYQSLRSEIGRVVVGQQAAIDGVLTAMLAGGHVLLEGPPGLGKTLLVRTLADVLRLDLGRIQFTPDLMPTDVIGTYVVMESHGRRTFEFQQGPIFTNLLLADEINRATPKTQAALLEGMEEGAVTVAQKTYDLPAPFFVLATQGPDGADGTFPLPQTQLDRFLFKLRMQLPSEDDLEEILARTTESDQPAAEAVLDGARLLEMSDLVRQVTIAPELRRQAARLVLATHSDHAAATPLVKQFVAGGSSPRGAQAIVMAAKVAAIVDGRANVAQEDLRAAALPALRHRITLNFDAVAERIEPDRIVSEITAE